jgi:hypothetical protein
MHLENFSLFENLWMLRLSMNMNNDFQSLIIITIIKGLN